MINEEDLLIIERSLAGDLETAEIKVFEYRLKTDSEFAMHYSIMRELPDAITTDVKGFSEDLKSIMEEGKVGSIPKKGPRSLGKMILAIAAVGVGIAIIAVLLNIRSTPDLFVQNFEIPPENITTRDNNGIDPDLQKALAAYKLEDFNVAAKSFYSYLQSYPEDQAAKFYLGISLLSVEKYAEAIDHFTTLEKELNTFQNSALWYHGLIELKLGENARAKELFEKLANTPAQSYQERSKTILDQIKADN